MSADPSFLTRFMPIPETSPPQVSLDFQVLRVVLYALSGIILWDFVCTLQYEWRVLRGKVPRSWPLGVYFAARYASVLFVGGVLPQAGSLVRVNCGAVWVVVSLAVTLQKSVGQALFMLRACAIWNWNRVILLGLLLIWLGNAALALTNIGSLTFTWTPDSVLDGYGYCTMTSLAWSVGAVHSCSLLTDFIIIALSTYRLANMRRAARCGFWLVLLNDGISWSLFTLPPTMGAVFTFYLGKTTPAQGIALVISSTMHAIIACRAYRNLSDFADTLPLSFCARDKVRNGTMLDQETLARLAWLKGSAGAEKEVPSREGANVDPATVDKLHHPNRPADYPFTSFSSGQSTEKVSPGSRHYRQSSLPSRAVRERPPAYRSRIVSTCPDRQHQSSFQSSSSSCSSEKNRRNHRRTVSSLDMLSAQVEPAATQTVHGIFGRTSSILSPGAREPINVHITTQMQSVGDTIDASSSGLHSNSEFARSVPSLDSPPARPARCEGVGGGRRRTQYVLRRPSHIWAPALESRADSSQEEEPMQSFTACFAHDRNDVGLDSFQTTPSTATTRPSSADARPLNTQAFWHAGEVEDDPRTARVQPKY
ncbi:hypothetical protein BCV69DRAFT_296653 [Microstroma glucosiphilum]|uniref:Transmembrane protein n=1 Tax=Pseudomicrostroma glucosiphilum TaxID=1684307 RepID=A0A316UFK0_9BASI|nr:hypothetical protein BCV69DRAFT_296653 [Pseudomicrostroma glucosiphilum]PWN22673.1 hypothetical protein BCV69DRAFT_296653 [Pseudomicrostroma glucosiphilum]